MWGVLSDISLLTVIEALSSDIVQTNMENNQPLFPSQQRSTDLTFLLTRIYVLGC